MASGFQREYLVRLPLPLAQLYSRAFNDKSARARHDNAFYLFEALIKLAAAPAIAAYALEIQHQGGRVEKLDAWMRKLARPAFGDWLGILRELSRTFSTRPDAASHGLGHYWEQLNRPRRDLPDLLKLYRRIKNGPDGEPAGDEKCSLLDVFNALIQYRNTVIGHGASRLESFYETEMGPLLFPAANEVLAQGVFDYLGPPGSQLVYVTEIRILEENRAEVSLKDLVGQRPERMSPIVLSGEQAAALLPNRVAVLWPGRPVPLRLDPLLLYRETELAEDVLFLNSDRQGTNVEYLSYASGATEREQTTTKSLAALLGKLTGREVTEEQLRILGEQSVAESVATDILAGPQELRGTRLGEYEILAEIGRGGMGVVYLARQLSLGRLVALKMLPSDLAGDEVALAQFRREIRHLARCEHPNIVKVLSSGVMPDGQHFYTMEYVPGCNLEQVWKELFGDDQSVNASTLGASTWNRAVVSATRKLREQSGSGKPRPPDDATPAPTGPFPTTGSVPVLQLPELPDLSTEPEDVRGFPRRVAALMRDAAMAVQTVHDRQVVHRDVKPANLMLTADGSRIVLMDFGLAKGQSRALSVSRQGGLKGTLRYAAPEQLAAASLKVGPQADVRGLGVTLWELLTRRRLFGEAADEVQLATLIHDSDVPRLRSIDPTLDRDLEAIVARATERRVADRIQTARQVAEYLQLYLDGLPLPIRPPTPAEMLRRWIRSHMPLVGATAAAAAAIVIAVVVSFVQITGVLQRESDAHNKERNRAESEARAKEEAQKQKAEAIRQQEVAERNVYLFILDRSQKAWTANNPAHALQLLEQAPQIARGWDWAHLNRLYRGARRKLAGHTGAIGGAAFDPTGDQLVTVGQDGKINVWDAKSGKELRTLGGAEGPIAAVAWSPNGRQIAAAGDDRIVRIWQADSGQIEHALPGHSEPVTDLAFSNDSTRLVSGSKDKTAKVWIAATGRLQTTFTEHDNEIFCLTFSPTGKYVASGGRDHEIRIWDPNTGKGAAHYFSGNPFYVADVVWHPDGQHLASCGKDNSVRIWDLEMDKAAWKEKRFLSGHSDNVLRLALSGSGGEIASASADRTVRLWNFETGSAKRTLRGHSTEVTAVAFSRDGSRLISGGSDGDLQLWDLTRSLESANLSGHTKPVATVAFSPKGNRLATGGHDGQILIWDPPAAKPLRTLAPNGKSILTLTFAPDGKRLAAGAGGGRITIWDPERNALLHDFETEKGDVRDLAFSPDGSLLACASDEQGVTLWNAATGRPVRSFSGHTDAVRTVAFSPDGKTLASAGADRIIRLWNVETGEEVRPALSGHEETVSRLAFSPDGRYFISADWKGALKIWNVASWTEHRTVRLAGGVTGFTFERGRLFVITEDGSLRILDTDLWLEYLALPSGAGTLNSLAMSADGTMLALAGDDNLVRIWLGSPLQPDP